MTQQFDSHTIATMRYLKLREAVAATGLHANTLRRYADQGTIESRRTPSGQRLFAIDAWLGRGASADVVCYARVSSQKQKDDLERQVAFLKGKHPEGQVVTDVASGLNFKRKGLASILERVMRGDKLRLVVAHRDRLARFGFDLIEQLVKHNGGEVVVLHKSHQASPAEEIAQDLLAVLGVFAERLPALKEHIAAIVNKDVAS